MSHNAESWESAGDYRANTGRHYYSVNSFTERVDPYLTKGGTYASGRRAASVHNQKHPDGWRDPSDYSALDIRVEEPWYTVWQQYPNRTDWYTAMGVAYAPPTNTSLPDFTALLTKVRSKALKKFGDQKVDFTVAWAERQKTIDLVADTARRLALSLTEGRKRLIMKASGRKGRVPRGQPRRKVTDAWLEQRYGWAPTLMDLEGAIDWLDSRDDGGYARYRIRSKASSKIRTDTPWTPWIDTAIGSYYPVPARTRDRSSEVIEVKGVYFATLEDKTFRTLQQCGVTNPLTTAWELVPYSFVVDWFVGVGQYLSNLSALDGLHFTVGSETKYVYRVCEREYDNGAPLLGRRAIGGHPSRGRRSYKEFQRTKVTSLSGGLVVKEHPFTALHMIDAISLLAGFIPGYKNADRLISPKQFRAFDF